MKFGPRIARKGLTGLAVIAVAAAMPAGPAQAQSDARIERLESQIRALQRAVFPGGDERFFEPEIDTAQPQQGQSRPAGTPASSALTDMLQRLEAIEAQLARLTAASEVNANALTRLEERVVTLEEGAETRSMAASTAQSSGPSGVIPVPGEGDEEQGGGSLGDEEQAGADTGSADTGPSPERLAAVQEIAKPASGDAGDDEYVYGFRLWDAGFYPEAQQQLSMFVEQYPDHWRTTYGRNLLGRAFLDAGEPRRAATYFFENYQDDSSAARAPDSLLYLSEAMIEVGDTRRACIALAEFGDTYPALAVGRLQEMYESNRNRVDCSEQ